MPKRVDHDVRRGEFADALVRSARVRGLHATGFREVAAEAGVSVNLVQYYFPTKEKLLIGGLIHLRALITERLHRKLAAAAGPAAKARVMIEELLPGDEVSTDLYRVHAAYAALALTDEALAAQPQATGPGELHPELIELVRAAQREGTMKPGRDPATVATNLLALTTGLSAYVLAGFHTVEAAKRILDDHFDHGV
ncbi:TetR/AcrR family transcriptional regulator [Amycolatopsis minnesotensis]|uniref:TetR/AcrR family transcriptional regulator n=1 Tax=Amycolatopsis minnesotensis TaxID=337894 RepID=A0ABN2QQ92_9PSEU